MMAFPSSTKVGTTGVGIELYIFRLLLFAGAEIEMMFLPRKIFFRERKANFLRAYRHVVMIELDHERFYFGAASVNRLFNHLHSHVADNPRDARQPVVRSRVHHLEGQFLVFVLFAQVFFAGKDLHPVRAANRFSAIVAQLQAVLDR